MRHLSQSGWVLSIKEEIAMSISARNVFKGQVTDIKEGPINAEVEITTAGGDKIVALLTESRLARDCHLQSQPRFGRCAGLNRCSGGIDRLFVS